VGEGGLANAGDVLDEQMTAGQDTGRGQANGVFLAHDDLADLGDERSILLSWEFTFEAAKEIVQSQRCKMCSTGAGHQEIAGPSSSGAQACVFKNSHLKSA